MRYDRIFITIGEDGFSPNCYLRFVVYFPFSHCSLPCHVSKEDPGCKGALYIMVWRRLQAQQRFYFLIFLSAVTCAHLTVDRSIWSHDRSSTWWDSIVNQSFNERGWLENFRMTRSTFSYLCAELTSLEKMDTVMRRAIPLEQRVAIALWRLATNGDYRTIAHLFGRLQSICLPYCTGGL